MFLSVCKCAWCTRTICVSDTKSRHYEHGTDMNCGSVHFMCIQVEENLQNGDEITNKFDNHKNISNMNRLVQKLNKK